MRNAVLLFLCLIPGFTIEAQQQVLDQARQKFIHYNEPNGLVLTESLQPGMTLYGLSRKYNVSMDSILSVNPDLDPKAIPLGYPVNIPIFSKAISFAAPQAEQESIPVFYRVQPRETLYRISRVYLGVSPETVASLNFRAEQGLAIGQVLHLGWYTPMNNTYSPVSGTIGTSETSDLYAIKDYASAYKMEGRLIREQKGLAVWKPGNMQSNFYVLHPTAKVGSYMEVTNPMLHRTLTAKVSGNIPPGLYQSHVGLVVSPSLARALGVLDQQFFAKWRFVE